jgi:hypothetical protein
LTGSCHNWLQLQRRANKSNHQIQNPLLLVTPTPIRDNIILVFLVVSFLLAFPPISYMHSSSTFVPYALLGLIILIILGEEYKLRSSSLCSFLQTPGVVKTLTVLWLHRTERRRYIHKHTHTRTLWERRVAEHDSKTLTFFTKWT